MAQPFVAIRDLTVAFDGVRVLHGVELTLERGEALGLVGESGSGKSVTWLAALGLLPARAHIAGSVVLDGQELVGAPVAALEKIRGRRMALISQDPASALNPVLSIGRQLGEAVMLHRGLSGKAARDAAIGLMERVGIPDASRRVDSYPHEFSGGQNQRIMIAMALAGEPELLIADEPTTALDVTIQAQILELLNEIRRDLGMALVLISHDLGIIAETCDRVAVMYAGRVVESAPAELLFAGPRHPYAKGLLGALPVMDGPRRPLASIPGVVPDPRALPPGCAFAPRCPDASGLCTARPPAFVRLNAGHHAACVLHQERVVPRYIAAAA